MIIRSQDKKRIANIDTCNLIAIVGSQGESQNITVDGMVVATYSTEEKAIKVLDMICAFENGKEEDLLYPMEYDYLNSFRAKNVFIMPQDSEV